MGRVTEGGKKKGPNIFQRFSRRSHSLKKEDTPGKGRTTNKVLVFRKKILSECQKRGIRGIRDKERKLQGGGSDH